jgi:hypothetical protein
MDASRTNPTAGARVRVPAVVSHQLLVGHMRWFHGVWVMPSESLADLREGHDMAHADAADGQPWDDQIPHTHADVKPSPPEQDWVW